MKKSLLLAGTVMVPLLLGGCVAAWGGSYNIDAQTADAVSIQYDTNFIDEQAIAKLASDHCSSVNRVAVLQTHETNMMNISTETFSCQNPPVPKP